MSVNVIHLHTANINGVDFLKFKYPCTIHAICTFFMTELIITNSIYPDAILQAMVIVIPAHRQVGTHVWD